MSAVRASSRIRWRRISSNPITDSTQSVSQCWTRVRRCPNDFRCGKSIWEFDFDIRLSRSYLDFVLNRVPQRCPIHCVQVVTKVELHYIPIIIRITTKPDSIVLGVHEHWDNRTQTLLWALGHVHPCCRSRLCLQEINGCLRCWFTVSSPSSVYVVQRHVADHVCSNCHWWQWK